jgi:hypothetical protein
MGAVQSWVYCGSLPPFELTHSLIGQFANISANYNIVNKSVTHINAYSGGVYQQAVSGLSVTDQEC